MNILETNEDETIALDMFNLRKDVSSKYLGNLVTNEM